MSALVIRLFGPAATVAAALVTSVASSEIPDKMHSRTLPFLCFATHPSMPFPPCGLLSDNPHAGSSISSLGSLPLSRPSSSNHISVCVNFVSNAAVRCAKGEDLVGSTGFPFPDQGTSLQAERYGVILERLLQRDSSLIDKIKGCVVDSAPVAELDPQVWASGFFAALMKKSTVTSHNRTRIELMQGDAGTTKNEIQPHVTEVALLAMLEKFFSLFLKLPYVKQRLSEVITILSKQQPQCPQLYIYSSADQVIPVKFVETFIDEQRRAGRIVRACNLYSSEHVDHYRSFPEKYSSQLNTFIQECLPQWSDQ